MDALRALMWRIFCRSKRRPSPLKTELANLRKNYNETDARLVQMSDDFWANGGVCCPHCGVPGYSDLCDKQARREQRMEQIENKLARDST